MRSASKVGQSQPLGSGSAMLGAIPALASFGYQVRALIPSGVEKSTAEKSSVKS
jgi:hypothetical protein